MPYFLKLAEKIYEKIHRENKFTNDPVVDLNNLFCVLRTEIKDSSYKLIYNYFDLEALVMGSEESTFQLDISIIPKYHNKDEYILWFASLIEKITYKYKEDKIESATIVFKPNYYYDEFGKIVSRNEDNGEEIIDYFKSKSNV